MRITALSSSTRSYSYAAARLEQGQGRKELPDPVPRITKGRVCFNSQAEGFLAYHRTDADHFLGLLLLSDLRDDALRKAEPRSPRGEPSQARVVLRRPSLGCPLACKTINNFIQCCSEFYLTFSGELGLRRTENVITVFFRNIQRDDCTLLLPVALPFI